MTSMQSTLGFIQAGERLETVQPTWDTCSSSQAIRPFSFPGHSNLIFFFITENVIMGRSIRALCSPTSCSKHMLSFQGDRALHGISHWL